MLIQHPSTGVIRGTLTIAFGLWYTLQPGLVTGFMELELELCADGIRQG